MGGKLLMLIRKRAAIILLASLVALLFFNLGFGGPPATKPKNPVNIAIEPAAKEVAEGEEFTLDIVVTPPPGQPIDGAQVFIDYQSEFLEVINVVPGEVLPLNLLDPP